MMPKTTRGSGGGKRHPLNMRTTKDTRDRLEAAAIANGRSLAQEVEARLDQSFKEEARFGGPAMLPIVNMLAGAFMQGGQLRAAAGGHPEWTPAEWLNDRDCYRAACHAVGFALNLPLPTRAEMSDPAAVHELLTGTIARGVPFKVTKEQDK